MKILTGIAILGVLGFAADAQAGTRHHHHHRAYAAARPLLVVIPPPPPFGDRYAVYLPPGPYQLSSPYHTLCGFSLVTQCSQESSFGP